MKRQNRTRPTAVILFALGLALVASACSDNSTGPAPTTGTPPGAGTSIEITDPVDPAEAASVRDKARRNADDSLMVDINEAIAIALAQQGGDLLGVKLDYDSDSLNYECVVRSGGQIYVIVIDPQTGSVIDRKAVTNAYYTTVILIRNLAVRLEEAINRVKAITSGDVVECNVENIDGSPTYIIVILDNANRYVTVYIDCKTGKERKVSDNGSDGKKHKHKRGRGHYRHGHGHGYGHHHHCHCHCGDDDGGNGGDTTNVRDSVITADSAKALATHLIDSSTAVEANLAVVNDSTASYTVKLERDSNRYEVVLDAFTGAFVSIEQTAGDMYGDFQPQAPNDTLVSLATARSAALAQLAGDVWRWRLEKDSVDNTWVYVFEILPTGQATTQHVVVDAATGAYKRTDP